MTPCFTPGARIATARGERAVEALRAGDRVVTRDNGLQEILWVGRRRLGAGELARAGHLRPVLIRAGALGEGLPERDMMVSPNHRVLVERERTQLPFDEAEVLVSAKHLVSGRAVRQAESLGVSYLHLMFARHELVLSNGLWTESFQPTAATLNGMGNAQRTELDELFPGLGTPEGLAAYDAARPVAPAPARGPAPG